MFYVGHFSFVKPNVDVGGVRDDAYGYFTAVAEAEDVANALGKFRDLIVELHKEEDILDGVTEVFLDSCVECISVPDSGFVAHFIEWFGSLNGSISTSIRGATEEQAVAYTLENDVDGDGDGSTTEPFLVFGKV